MQKYLDVKVKETIKPHTVKHIQFHCSDVDVTSLSQAGVNMAHVIGYHLISVTVAVHVKDTGEVWSDHRRLEGWRGIIAFLEYYGNNVISNVPLSLHLTE